MLSGGNLSYFYFRLPVLRGVARDCRRKDTTPTASNTTEHSNLVVSLEYYYQSFRQYYTNFLQFKEEL